MPLDLTALEAEVNRNTSVDASASLLLKRLFDEVEANKNNPAALQALVDRVRADNDTLAASVSAHTPAESGGGTAPPPEPEPGPDGPQSASRKR